MRQLLTISLLCGLLALCGCDTGSSPNTKNDPGTPTTPETGVKLIAENTKITFVGTKPEGDKHDGGFEKVDGFIDTSAGAETVVHLDIQTDSLWSDNKEKLTPHLKSGDFFDVKNHPKASFVAKKLEKKEEGENTHVLTGELTLLGKTSPITVPVKLTDDESTVKLDATFKIDRTKWGMTYGEGKIDKEVTITVKIDAEK